VEILGMLASGQLISRTMSSSAGFEEGLQLHHGAVSGVRRGQ
jgi:hypothetical protein